MKNENKKKMTNKRKKSRGEQEVADVEISLAARLLRRKVLPLSLFLSLREFHASFYGFTFTGAVARRDFFSRSASFSRLLLTLLRDGFHLTATLFTTRRVRYCFE